MQAHGALGVLEGVVEAEEPVRAVQVEQGRPAQDLLLRLQGRLLHLQELVPAETHHLPQYGLRRV